jgi:hypothetical protein
MGKAKDIRPAGQISCVFVFYLYFKKKCVAHVICSFPPFPLAFPFASVLLLIPPSCPVSLLCTIMNPVANVLTKIGRSTLTCMSKGAIRSIPLASMHSTATINKQPLLGAQKHQQSDPLSQAKILSSKAQQYFERGRYAPMVANLQVNTTLL